MKKLLLIVAISMNIVNFACVSPTPNHTVPAGKVAQWKGYDVIVKRDSLGIVTVDGKPAAVDEITEKATAYQQGLFSVIIYKSGKVALMKQGQFVGYLKRN
ncbi:hypothetical protein [Erwinia wuhanensis]|uniref:hypothetical protein n=1 Tax=Erwinia wuhanensis TaxID=3045167 RepID=UPI00403F5A3A